MRLKERERKKNRVTDKGRNRVRETEKGRESLSKSLSTHATRPGH